MKQSLRIVLLLFSLSLLLVFYSNAYPGMSNYCQTPPFTTIAASPNVLFVTDNSGSMGWCAYNPDAEKRNCCGNSLGCGWTYTGEEEGYFRPDKVYGYNSSGFYWEEIEDVASTCPTYSGGISTLNYYRGSCLNFHYMTRIDLVRWAITGGTPARIYKKGGKTIYDSCVKNENKFKAKYCDPEVWDQSGNQTMGKVGTVCNDTYGGCIMRTNTAQQVRVPWSRVWDGLAFKFKELTNKPRTGVMFYSGSSVEADKVYIGDFTNSPGSKEDEFPYMNLVTYINSIDPGGSTPSGPAMWDALNYLKQVSPKYGGFNPQTSEDTKWRNPAYSCNHGATVCTHIPCAKNFVILMSDGQWNKGGYPVTDACTIDTGYEDNSADPVVPAYQMHMGFTNTVSGFDSKVTAIYSIGLFLGGTGEKSLKNVAMYGSFNTAGGERQWPDGTSDYPKVSCNPIDDCCDSALCGKGSSCSDIPDPSHSDWDTDEDGLPDTYYYVDNAITIREAIMNVVIDVIRRAASGTSVSLLASSEGSGANLIQAIFHPLKPFGLTEIGWIGEMQNLWYYIDPRLQHSNIREDTVPDKELNLMSDYITQFYFDSSNDKTVVKRFCDADGDGQADSETPLNIVDLEEINNLWGASRLQGAGRLLWYRDLGSSPRTIYTTTDGSSLIPFSTSYAEDLESYLQAADVAEATDIINYVHGIDKTGHRNRKVTISEVDDTPRVWKLGDIVSSTPRGQTWVPLNDYHSAYKDLTYLEFINDSAYKERGMVYVGANDGMLHAIRHGKPEIIHEIYRLIELSGTNLGYEDWAFIPKNALPYLKYLGDPSYCHLYYVDGAPYLFDASINIPTGCSGSYWDCVKEKESWRTILVGSMGLGGACRNYDSDCTDCLKTPIDGVGYSSYFALDVTDPQNPSLLWEFSDPGLGLSISGPAIVRIGNGEKNGRWFAIFASGPTGPVDTTTHQFLGRSDQNLNLFIVDLKTGDLLHTIDTGIAEAFGGSMINATIDLHRNVRMDPGHYQDDAFYVGYVKKVVSDWKGGVLRVVTNEDADPVNWSESTVIDNIGPVTTSISHLLDRTNRNLWLYFGTGRYFYKMVDEIDDGDSQQALYGVKDPCYDGSGYQVICTLGGLTDVTNDPDKDPQDIAHGWYINLDNPPADGYKAERVITNPLAAFSGAVFFTTFAPSTDPCAFGGNTYLWAVKYSTGGLHSAIDGQAMVQVSTGSIEELNLSTAFTEKGGRRTSAFTGVPPRGQGLSILVRPKAIKRIQQIHER